MVATTTAASRTAAAPMARGGLALLASGHLLVDMTVGALPAFLPLFKDAFRLSDTRTTMIVGTSAFASSAIQPLFGLLADRRARPEFLWGGVLVAAAGLAAMGFMGGYWAVLGCVMGSGVGVAAYHPEATRVAHAVAGTRKAAGVGLFIAGGNLGFALGPLIAGLLTPSMHARASVVFLLPGAVACVLLVANLGRLDAPLPPPRRARAGAPAMRGATALLVAVASLRTWTQFGLLSLVPLYLKQTRGTGTRAAGAILFAFSISGILSTPLGGLLADRVGSRRMLVATVPLISPLVAGFVLTRGSVAGIVCLTAAGVLILSSLSVTVVMGQRYLPGRPALAAGLLIGFASIGSAAPGLIVVGVISDALGRTAALWTIASFPLAAAALATMLPRPPGERA